MKTFNGQGVSEVTAAPEVTGQQAFEQAMRSRGMFDMWFEKDDAGEYTFSRIRDAYVGWHAALSQLKQAAQPEIDRLTKLINTPELHDFAKGVALEAVHQREKWGSAQDGGKSPADWFWLIGYLAQKAMTSQLSGDADKALHHTITTAAALANWHAAIQGLTNMRPGIAPPAPTAGEKP